MKTTARWMFFFPVAFLLSAFVTLCFSGMIFLIISWNFNLATISLGSFAGGFSLLSFIHWTIPDHYKKASQVMFLMFWTITIVFTLFAVFLFKEQVKFLPIFYIYTAGLSIMYWYENHQ
jgi:hypothetical protein